jgi:signal transduction histidine kinase
MSLPATSSPQRWAGAITLGFTRSVVLTGLTVVMPAVGVAVGLGGSRFTLSWSAHLTAPLVVRVLATAGEVSTAVGWTAAAAWIVVLLAGQPLSQAARLVADRWLGVRIEARYRPVPPVTRMATGYWWNGYEYQRSERIARRRAWAFSRRRDPQVRRDALWLLVAGVTVLPVAALPLLALAGGAYAALTPGLLEYGVAMTIASVVIAPFAWTILRPLVPRFLGPAPGQRIEELESIRADLTQTQAAELERIERGLHDGAQARLVALGMSMGAAEQLIDADPAAAKAILAEARGSSAVALAELRSLVRGINPPVLAERGLVDAVRAIALDAPVEVAVRSTVPSRPERPVESAVYFAVAELLVNAVKHAHAALVTVDLGYRARTLTAIVADDGAGGAVASQGSGLSGIERRMAAFGGQLEIESPAGGPTRITVAVPCVLS